jgi:hypothetical protein
MRRVSVYREFQFNGKWARAAAITVLNVVIIIMMIIIFFFSFGNNVISGRRLVECDNAAKRFIALAFRLWALGWDPHDSR